MFSFQYSFTKSYFELTKILLITLKIRSKDGLGDCESQIVVKEYKRMKYLLRILNINY